jgi:hypothetical protein
VGDRVPDAMVNVLEGLLLFASGMQCRVESKRPGDGSMNASR